MLGGLSYYPFLETMHPSVQVAGTMALGPVVALNTADDTPLFERWGDVETHFAPLVRAGIQIRIMSGNGGAYRFRLGYDYLHFSESIDDRSNYSGIFFQAGMEFIGQ